ncbi:hypothetical protein MKW92_042451 [Papaver armeniacum]|nr:hypothetical protein MKW92_042451 [Papaver armeniacum]
MGCTQSKIENEEAVSRCKDRKQFMPAHSSYSVALKNTGAALSDYSHGEVNLSNHQDLLINHNLNNLNNPLPPPPPPLPPNATQQPSYEANLPPPPPPLPNFSPTPLKRANTMPEFNLSKPDLKQQQEDTIQEEDEDDEDENGGESVGHDLNHRRRSRGGRSVSNGGKRDVGSGGAGGGGGTQQPSSPPHTPVPPPPPESKGMTWDYFFSMDMPHVLNENDEIRPDNDETEYHIHKSTTSGFRSEHVVHEAGGGSHSNGHVHVIDDDEVEPQTPEKWTQPGGKGGKSVSLLQVLAALDDHFLKASESAHDVSKMLEATRLHYHSNFADNSANINHSERVMRVITWNRSFRNMGNGDDGKDDFDLEDKDETHATVLDKLLAWEKNFMMNKKRGAGSEALEKNKSSCKSLAYKIHCGHAVHGLDCFEINRLRDKQLYPKLTKLVEGMAAMWEAMHRHHGVQQRISESLKYVDINQTTNETSEQHHERTIQLWGVVQEWHAKYIQALNSWLKLNLIPIGAVSKGESFISTKNDSPCDPTPIASLAQHLEKLPNELAGKCFSVCRVINNIKVHQEQEMKLKEKCEDTRREFSRKSRAFEDWHHKYTQRRTPPDEMDPDRSEDPNHKDPVAERQFVVESLKKRLEEEVQEYHTHCRQVRELFRAMSDFSSACSDMYKKLETISSSQKSSGTPA